MSEPLPRGASFPTAHCERCDKAVLTYLELDQEGEECRRCVHCETSIDLPIQWVPAEELEAYGYSLDAPSSASDSSACGGGCGSCSVRKT